MQSQTTIFELISAGDGGATAIGAPGEPALTFDGLREQVGQTVAAFNEMGIGRNDRVAIVLENGPEMAVAFMAVAAGATSAPLNPAYRAEEFEFYLSDLNAKALLVQAQSASPAVEVARKLGIRIIELHPTRANGAGSFTLDKNPGVNSGAAANPGLAQPDDVALVLHTSGTTSRPKIVPLTHRNVCASARNIRGFLSLDRSDRGLNIMPLFHIHGLIAGVLAPLSAGGQVSCTPGFNALKFFAWMEQVRPTWYTAVPTMHQTILARAANNRAVIQANPLRFIRSSSSAMPTQVISELEKAFGAPLVESYGMTEAAHQMAANPLPPWARKPGTLGIAAGPEVAIMDELGALLPVGTVGEVVIRGENVTPGYENNPKANAEAFTDGWFRTGDQGVMDDEGYLTITGRLKEIINRGGEKVSPREVDEVLMDHPSVAQVVTFAIPHDKLGEEVGAAIVLKEA
ncbi:MAG: AMP-binding protein, partial [Quisquiliibacterium sp.]